MSFEALEKRFLKAAANAAPPRRVHFDLPSVLFGPQLAFVNDSSQFATASCSRRAGKSVGIGAWLLEGPIKNPRAPSLYLTLTRGSAKRIIWPTLLELNRKHRLGYEPNESDLVLKRNGKGSVFLIGVDNKSEIEKARGTGWGRVAIDEAQSLPAYIKDLVEDVLMPSFADHGGQLRMIGTPAPVPVGFFYDATQIDGWAHHSWTVWDNPYVPKARETLDAVLKVRGVTEDHPSIQREWMGRWAYDPSALVFRFDAAKNVYAALPNQSSWQYVIGVDLGFDDADAISVLAWTDASPALYLVDEWVGSKQSITDLGIRLTQFRDKYQPLDIVADTGGLGKKIADEISQRTGIPISAAEKERKLEHIELLNDALRSGRFYAKADSRFAQDCMLVEWDRTNPEKPKISDRFHSDICDSVLYAYRRSMHWHYEPAEVKSQPGEDRWYTDVERELIQAAERSVREQKAYRQETDDQWEWI